jgi:hypothetical protein
MKNKSAVMFVLGVALFLAVAAYAAQVRGAKGITSTYGSTSAVMVSSGPTAVYSVMIGTGAVTDFVVLFDSNSTNGITSLLQTSASGYRVRVYASSATQPTQVTLDPPWQFNNGLVAINATGVMTSVIGYEKGRVTQGY